MILAPQRPIAVIGDTQRTLRVERYFLRREQNQRERALLLQHLLGTEFELLVHLGDMVENGSSAAAWQEFDRLFAPFFAKGIRFVPLMGNHDYWGNKQRRCAHLQTRFPSCLNSPWQALAIGRLGLILLDSNISQYSGEVWAKQANWFESTLQRFELEASVAAVIVFSHHPPFTNSAVLRRAKHLEDRFLPAFFAAHKTRAFISGHVHGYERFTRNGKTFIVSGGGGGPRLPLRPESRRRYDDQFSGAGLRPFHYLLLHPEAGRLVVEVKGVNKEETHVRLVERFAIDYCEGATARALQF